MKQTVVHTKIANTLYLFLYDEKCAGEAEVWRDGHSGEYDMRTESSSIDTLSDASLLAIVNDPIKKKIRPPKEEEDKVTKSVEPSPKSNKNVRPIDVDAAIRLKSSFAPIGTSSGKITSQTTVQSGNASLRPPASSSRAPGLVRSVSDSVTTTKSSAASHSTTTPQPQANKPSATTTITSILKVIHSSDFLHLLDLSL